MGAVLSSRRDTEPREHQSHRALVVIVQHGEEALEGEVTAGESGVLARQGLEAAEDALYKLYAQ